MKRSPPPLLFQLSASPIIQQIRQSSAFLLKRCPLCIDRSNLSCNCQQKIWTDLRRTLTTRISEERTVSGSESSYINLYCNYLTTMPCHKYLASTHVAFLTDLEKIEVIASDVSNDLNVLPVTYIAVDVENWITFSLCVATKFCWSIGESGWNGWSMHCECCLIDIWYVLVCSVVALKNRRRTDNKLCVTFTVNHIDSPADDTKSTSQERKIYFIYLYMMTSIKGIRTSAWKQGWNWSAKRQLYK